MQYTIDADDEFLRVRITGCQVDRPPHEVCAAVLIDLDQREFINLVARNHGVMVRNFAGVQPALAWLRGEKEA